MPTVDLTDVDALREANAELRREQESANAREAAVRDVIQTIARTTFDLDAVLQTVVDRAVDLCHADTGNLARRDGDVYRVVAFTSPLAEYERLVREHIYVPERGSMIGRALLERRVVHVHDVLEDPDYTLSGIQWAGGFRTILSVPMLREGSDAPIGALGVSRNEVRPFSDVEIRLVETFAGYGAVALENVRLFQTVERQRTELARFISPQVAELITSADGEQLLAGHRAYISSFFCDLRGSTAFAETAEPEELLDVIRRYHALLGELVPLHGGTLEHFAGDGILIFFNDPVAVEEHELKAIKLALDVQQQFAQVAGGWRKRGIELGLGIGIAAGYATLGRIGFEGRYDYAALGTVNNLAARLGSQAEAGQTLVSQRVFAAVEDAVEAEAVGELELKGFGRPVLAYEVRALR
jgi:adenylate cyclase